jgi:hypothetical protein
MSNAPADLSIVMATFNRAETLRRALQAMAGLDAGGLRVEYVIANNNSSDHTAWVLDEFAGRLPLVTRFVSRPGKNIALNCMLQEVPLGQIVVFTDDDVEPRVDWLQAIYGAAQRHPQQHVFGGKILPIWSEGSCPAWFRAGRVQVHGFNRHDLGEEPRMYPAGGFPNGANFWVRRFLLDGGRRFDERIGPCPGRRRMGSEAGFLLGLEAEGYQALYVPDAVVGHVIRPELATPRGIRRRAYSNGRGLPYFRGPCRPELLRRSPWLWRLLRAGAAGWAALRCLRAMMSWSLERRLSNSLEPVRDLAYNLELLRTAGDFEKEVRAQS